MVLCARCYDVTVAFDAIQFDAVLFDLRMREQQDDLCTPELYDEMLARLDEILAANRHRDHDGRLARSVALQRACTLDDAGRYAEALRACEAWAEIGFNDDSDRQLCRCVKAMASLGKAILALAAAARRETEPSDADDADEP